MQVQVRSLASNSNIQMAALGLLVLMGILYLSFGAAYISAGNPVSALSLVSLVASTAGVRAVGAYAIIAGLYLMAGPLFIYWNLLKNRTSARMSSLSWLLTVFSIIFTFSAAILTAQVYTPVSRYLKANDAGFSDFQAKIRNMFNFALALTIITFILAWPASIYLLIAANYHRSNIGIQSEDQSAAGDNSNVQMSPDEKTRHYPTESPAENTIDLERETYTQSFKIKEQEQLRKQQDQAPKEFTAHLQPVGNLENTTKEQQRSPEREREGSPARQLPRLSMDTRLSKKEIIYSSPSFEVQMPQMPRRSMHVRQSELPQASLPRNFMN